MNAHCERVTGTIRREALDHVLTMNEAHARQVLAEYRNHYNRHRLHRSGTNDRPRPRNSQHSCTSSSPDGPAHTRVLGGFINEYQYAT
ncbi:integrase core domain-containing protein [Streptomyces sp. NBC_00009]|uniref:integrase core domain-containing protein n=1 Tax=Streptomyces sp. NBC_00009 TaxID=2975620 RepID=UPI00386382F2